MNSSHLEFSFISIIYLTAARLTDESRIIVTMTHASKHGQSKLLTKCSLSLTGKGCIKKVLTDLALIEIKDNRFHLLERAPGVSVEEIIKLTAGELVVPEHVPEMVF